MAEACRGVHAWKCKFSNSVNNNKKKKILIHFFINKTAFQIPPKSHTQMMALQRQYFVCLYIFCPPISLSKLTGDSDTHWRAVTAA